MDKVENLEYKPSTGGEVSHVITKYPDIEATVRFLSKAKREDLAPFCSARELDMILEMISRSDILITYKDRMVMEKNDQIRLDYHLLDKALHFQVLLRMSQGQAEVRRIYICR